MKTEKRSCVGIEMPETGFVKADEQPDEDCINCIHDDILATPEGEIRDFWIAIYREGRMSLNCARTGKSFMINKEFFDSILLKNFHKQR